jgi:hypothetical protein
MEQAVFLFKELLAALVGVGGHKSQSATAAFDLAFSGLTAVGAR